MYSVRTSPFISKDGIKPFIDDETHKGALSLAFSSLLFLGQSQIPEWSSISSCSGFFFLIILAFALREDGAK